jgi:6-phosphogluconolactonase
MAQRFYAPPRRRLSFLRAAAATRKIVFALYLLAAIGTPIFAEANGVNRYVVYVGTYTVRGSRGIYAYSFDPASGHLGPLGLQAEAANPAFLAVAPNRRFLYSVSETDDYKGQHGGSLLAYRIDPKTGQLTSLNQVASGGMGPCYLSLDNAGKFVLTANYGGGSVSVFPLLPDGKLGEASAFVQHSGSGVNPDRQTGPHTHFIKTTFDDKFAITADLGLDQLMLYKFDSRKGALSASTPASVKVQGGAGPRHFVFHPNHRHLYLVNELDSSVSVFSYDQRHGALQPKQTTRALARDFKGESYAAEIQIDASGKFLYVSNRGADSIALFRINPESGMLNAVETVPSGGKTPRYFAIDPSGKFLLVGNQDSDNIVTFRIDQKSGKLTKADEIDNVISPACFAFLQIE